MKRLILATGKWSTILTVAYLKSRGDRHHYEDTLVHMSHVCDQIYLDSFNEFCSKFWNFSGVHCINYCIYEASTPENFTFGDLKEKSDQECTRLLLEILGDEEYDEIIVPHLFSAKSRLLMKIYSKASAYCIEEGLNSYFRHHSKVRLDDNERYFLSRLQGYVSFNFMGLQPLFDFDAHGVPIIVPEVTYAKEAIDCIAVEGLRIAEPHDPNKVLFIGQFARADMSVDQLLEHYLGSISSLLLYGFSVHFVKHPRDVSILTELLREAFAGQPFHIIDAPNIPVERIASSYSWCAAVSYASSALVTIPALYQIPAFTIDEYDLDKLVPGGGDFGNARNFCAVVVPTLRSLLAKLDVSGDRLREVAAEVFRSFPPQHHLLKRIYAPKPPGNDIQSLTKLPLRGIEERIRRNPFNSKLRLAHSLREQNYARGMKSAWQGLLLHPGRLAAYRIVISKLLSPVSRKLSPIIPDKEADVFSIAGARPLSIEALFGYARLLERKSDYSKALEYRLLSVLTHPLHPLSYYNLLKWAQKKATFDIRNKRSGYLFDFLFDRSLRRLQRQATAVKKINVTGKNISALAYRPNKGATGGPGGVLALQKAVLGPYFRDRLISYNFRGSKLYTDWYADIVSGGSFALDLCKTDEYAHFFSHDLGCAYALALAGRSYVLDWHFQGSFVTQMLNFGHTLSPSFIEKLKIIEGVAMKGAKYVVFPSNGARDMYFDDEFRGCNREDVCVGPSVYNTILPGAARPNLSVGSSLPAFDGITFTSVGTLTLAKGQDQVLDFLERMLPHAKTPVRWICIGDGIMREELLLRANKLADNYEKFEFTYLPKIPHKQVMNVLHASDVYIMLHRISIFDFATLEAMKNKCAIVLSKVGGNVDFDKEDNILFAEDMKFPNDEAFSAETISRLKELNADVFNRYFSIQNFKNQNFDLLEKLCS